MLAHSRGAPLVVGVASLFRGERRARDVTVSVRLAGLSITGSAVDPETEIEVAVRLEPVGEQVMVSGRIVTTWEGACRRCLTTVRGELAAECAELFLETDDLELGYPISGGELDLEPLVRDACILALPLAPLCAEDCRGLCPECGIDNNEVDCGCGSRLDPRWSALTELTRSGLDDGSGCSGTGV
jgi:uncharacterized protein